MKVGILGGGALGKVMFGLVSENEVADICVYDVKGSDIVNVSTIEECVGGADIVFICVPSFAVEGCVKEAASFLKDGSVVVNCAKGLADDFSFLTDVIGEVVGEGVGVAELSGPAIAREISEKIHTKVDVVCEKREDFDRICSVLNRPYFQCVRAYNMHAVELGGIIKNVYALLCGIVDGVHGGTNTKAFIMTEGMSEMADLGEAMGCERELFYGLAGLGDLLTTCMSGDSRNRRFGEALAGGKGVQEAMDDLGMVAEGYYSTKTVKQLSEKYGVGMPLLNALYVFLYEKGSLEQLLERIVADEVIVVS